MNTLKYRMLSNWHFTRIVRLVIGLFMLAMSIQTHDWTFGLLSLLFVGMALTDTGCCGAQGCAVPNRPVQTDKNETE
jgi:hypothetical protein